MSRTVTLTVDDTAPMVTYIPNLEEQSIPQDQQLELFGWIAQFNNRTLNSLGQLGNGTSNHLTSATNAGLQFDFTGTGVTLFGVAQQISYSILLDELTISNVTFQPDSQILYQSPELPAGNHTITLIVHEASGTTDSFISFDRALLQTKVNGTSNDAQILSNLILDGSLAFMGSWSAMQVSPELVSGSNGLSLTTFHQTAAVGDSVSIHLPFPNSVSSAGSYPISFSILGFRDFLNGLYSVTLSDNQGHSHKQIFNASFGWHTATELFVLPDMHLALGTNPGPQDKFTIKITNEEAKPLAIAAINVTNVVSPPGAGSSSSTMLSTPTIPAGAASKGSSLPVGTIVALVLSSISIAIFIAVGLVFFLFRQRYRRKERGIFSTPSQRRSPAAAAGDKPTPQTKSKSKSESTGSVLDIGRQAPITHQPSRDRFTHSMRPLSLPRTARSSSANGNGNGNGNGNIRDYLGGGDLSDDIGRTTIEIPAHAPFIFSFDTSSSNSPTSRHSQTQTRSRSNSNTQWQQQTIRAAHAISNSSSSGSGRRREAGSGVEVPLVSRFSVSTQPNSPHTTSYTNAVSPSSHQSNFNGNIQNNLVPLSVSGFSDGTRQTAPQQQRSSGASLLPPISIPDLSLDTNNPDDTDSPTLPSEENSRPPDATEPSSPPPSYQRSRSDPEVLLRLLPQLQIPTGNGQSQTQPATSLTATSRPYEWGYAYRPESWAAQSLIQSHGSHSEEERERERRRQSELSEYSSINPIMLFTLPTPTQSTRGSLHPFAQTYGALTPSAANSRRTSSQTQRTDLSSEPETRPSQFRISQLPPIPSFSRSESTRLSSRAYASDSDESPRSTRPPRRRGLRRSFSLVFRNRSSLEAENISRLRPPGFELGDVILGPRPRGTTNDR